MIAVDKGLVYVGQRMYIFEIMIFITSQVPIHKVD